MPKQSKTTTKRPARATRAPGIGVLLVDDHPMWRDTVRVLVETSGIGRVVGETNDGAEVVDLARKTKPDVVIMDMGLPSVQGAAATAALVGAFPKIRVLVLSASDDRSDVLDAVDAGATGYLLKTAAPEEVVDAVQRVHRGEAVFPPTLSDVVLRELRDRASHEHLRVTLFDPSVLTREGLVHVLAGVGLEVVDAVGDVTALEDSLIRSSPDVVVIDAPLDGAADASPVQVVRRSAPDVGIVVLSARVDAPSTLNLLKDGTGRIAYVLKERVRRVEQLEDVIRRVAHGESVVEPDLVARLLSHRQQKDLLADLSAREREVLSLMAEGRSNQAIGERLHLTAKTVEAHVRAIFMKFGLEQAADDHRRVMAVITYLRTV